MSTPETDTPDTPETTSPEPTSPRMPATGTAARDGRHDDTLATQVFAQSSPAAPVAGDTAPPGIPERPYLQGPAPFAIVLGLLGLLVVASVLVGELTDVDVEWGNLGPWIVVAGGVVVLLVGAIGLRASRSRE